MSFIMASGLDLVLPRLSDAVERGARARILTTDYLKVTDPVALAQLLDLAEASHDLSGSLEARIWQDPQASFHPKAYLFSSSTGPESVGFVGSSNLSRSGIAGGVEWNLGIREVRPLIASFEGLWADDRSVDLTHAFLRAYRDQRNETPPVDAPTHIGVEIEPPVQPVAPRPIQEEALEALTATRTEGFARGLVVMATGLGKTWLAAFNTTRPEFRRTLFIAHREEILRQSRDVFRGVRPDAELGLFHGGQKDPDADVVFASIQTLSRRLHEFDPDDFDYIVVDEFHHAAASTYRAAIDHFNPTFLLGLTATPERMDGADLLALCDDNLVFECDLLTGIGRRELAPFRYRGLKDVADFEPIPWRNDRFDPEALSQAVETQTRAQQALDAWREHGGGPTLAFCCSITHARFMARFFNEAGVRAVAVHSGEDSAPRQESVADLRTGDVEVIFAVDVFSEGVDIPEIQTVLMLRPTDSPVVFLQQLGRGLRKAEAAGKDHLKVVDFIGNHRSFLAKPRALLSLGGRIAPTPKEVIEAARLGEFDLPEGCSVDYDLEAVDLLASMARTTSQDALADFCRDYTEEHGYRPSAMQAFRSTMNPRSARNRHGNWFGLLADLDLLGDSERQTVSAHNDTLVAVEKESATRSYKLVALRALLHDGALRAGASIGSIAATSQRLVAADPRLVADTQGKDMADPANATPEKWERFWRKWPIEHLANAKGGPPLFRIVDERLEPTFDVPDELGDTFDALVAEWRLAEYLLRDQSRRAGTIRCKVSHTDGKPIIRFDRRQHPEIPEGWEPFTANGETFDGHFVKIALNVAERPGEKGNAIHDLLRGWFGPSAGQPGTNHAVLLQQMDDGWEISPEARESSGTAEVIPLFPTYEVACGAFAQPNKVAEATQFSLTAAAGSEIDPTRNFVAFAAGDSMEGGTDPIRPGDPLLFEWARNTSRTDLDGERVLVEQHREGRPAAVPKRLVGRGRAGSFDPTSQATQQSRAGPTWRSPPGWSPSSTRPPSIR